MDKRKYFSDLINLYEAIGMAGTPEVIPQEQVADTGMDVNGQIGSDPAMMGQDPSIMDPSMGGQAIDPMTGMPLPPEPTPEENLEKEKLKKLFELFEDLLNYGDVFVENIKFLNLGLLDETVFRKVNMYTDNIKNLLEKISNYMKNIFNTEKYDNILYAYILFRTELITTIKSFRDILKLDKPEDKLDSI